MRRHRVLLVAWAILIGSFTIGLLLVNFVPRFETIGSLMIGLPFLLSMLLSLVTYIAVKRHDDDDALARRRLYQLLVGTLLLSSTVTLVASGSTIAWYSKSPIGVVGLATLGATNVLIAILAWRALVHPTARRAARVGMIAVVFEMIALIPDIAMSVNVRELDKSMIWTPIALFAAFISMGTGALACIASLVAFEPRENEVPSARVVED